MKKSIPIDEITLRKLIESLNVNIENGEVDGQYIVSLSADNMTAGTLIGRSIKAVGGSGNDVWLDSTFGQLKFMNNNTLYGYIETDASMNMLYVAKTTHFFFDNSNHYIGKLYRTDAVDYGLELTGGSQIQWTAGTNLKDTGATLQLDRTLEINGDCALSTGKKFQVGTTGGVTFSSGNVGGLFQMNAVGGIITFWQKF